MGLMSEYLTGDNKLKPNPVTIKIIYISFITAYGARSILVTYKENEEEILCELQKISSASFKETRRRPSQRRRNEELTLWQL